MPHSFSTGLVGDVKHGCGDFGSGQGQISQAMAETGQQERAAFVDNQGPFPGFWGGTGDQHVEHVPDEVEQSFQVTTTTGPMSSLDYVVQNLQCRLGNPRNRCYANSAFRLWAWAGSFMEGPQLWQRTSSAVLEALANDEVVQLTTLQGLRPLWDKFDDEQQNDASHFLQELVGLAHPTKVIMGFYQVDHSQAVHHRKAFPVHLIFPDQAGSEELEQLIGEWANTQEGQVFDVQGLWVAQIGRYTKVQGQWTKHHRPLRVPSIFNLPYTLDGNTTRTRQYSIVGYLCHSGTEHQHGHFYAVFIYRGMSWIVDDGSYPKVLSQITETTKQQIVQVWAVPSEILLPAAVPHDDVSKVDKVEEPPTKRRNQEGVSFEFANITNVGQQVRQWLISKSRVPIFVVETHLGPDDHNKMMQWMTARGYSAMGAAAAESVKGGTNGGIMMLFPQDQHVHFVQKQIIDGCGWYGVIWSFAGAEILMISAYFKCGEGIQGPTNAELWAGLIAFVTSIQKPVVIVGDFNVTPETFMTTTIGQHMQLQVCATGEETCHSGNELDWALVSNHLAADLRGKVSWMDPFKPHALVQYSLAGQYEAISVQQLTKFGPAPKLHNPEKTWYQTEPQEVRVQWLQQHADPLTQQMGSMYHRIERYVLQQLEEPTTGRGLTLQYINRPLHDASKPWIWKRGSLAYWNQMEVRLQQLLQQTNREPRFQTHLQKLGWKIEDNWHPDAPLTCEGFRLLFEMLWHQHDEEHIFVLLKFARQLRDLHQAESFQKETEEYRQWLTQAAQQGCRGLFRTLKKDEMPFMRPFQELPRVQRMPKRVEQWGAIWSLQAQPKPIACMEKLITKGQQEAKNLPFMTDEHIWRTIKSLSIKAPGLDGIGFDFLKTLPREAMKDLRELFAVIEEQAMIPSQWKTSLIAMLPKNQVIERPIALVSTMYRLWCRLRNQLTKSWASNIQQEYPWERAVPGTECLQVALKRSFMTEYHSTHKRSVISVLLDLSNFYDRIALDKLAQRWLESTYPATHAALAMQVYTGQRILEAEGEASQPLWTANGILAGDPQAPLAAKVYLQRALKEFHRKYPQLHSDLWIDDFSFDVVDRNPHNAARIALLAYEFIKQELEKDNLKVSEQKTGFIASNATVKKILQEQLPKSGPKVHDVMRDLGIDCTAGRLRRLQTMKARRKKAGRKSVKLATLKIPTRSIQLKLYKGSIMAGISWGHQAMGLAPQVRKRWAGRWAYNGRLDILFDMHPRHQDPDQTAFEDQIKVYRKFDGNWPEELVKDLAKAWQVHREKLTSVQYPWQHAKGPVGALQCYLLKRGWNIQRHDEWTKPGHNGEPEFKLNMHADWFHIKEELERARKWETVTKVNKRAELSEVQQPLDWLPWRRLARQLSKPQYSALQTWHQGAIFTKVADGEETKRMMCPHCAQEATAIHVLWTCKEINKAFPPLDQADRQEIEYGINREFWSQGLVQLPKYELSTGGAAVQCWGSWTLHDEVRLQGIEVVTLGIAPTSSDPRLKYFAVALVHHTLVDGELYRKGAVTTILPGKQCSDRAWYYGLRLISHYVDLQSPVRAHLQSRKAWEAWVHGRHSDTFYDLQSLVTHDQRSRIRPLLLTTQQIKDMPPGPFTLKARAKDAGKTAKEIALSLRPIREEEELRLMDQRYNKIATLAIARIKHLLETKEHYLHQSRETGKQNRQKAKERKHNLFLEIGGNQNENKHIWQTKGRALQCQGCNKRITKHLTCEALQQIKEEDCPATLQLVIQGGQAEEAQSKTALVKSMIEGSHPAMTDHQFVQQTNYVVCTRCNGRILRHAAKEKIESLASSTCWNGEWIPTEGWAGHSTHKMWRKGGKLFCLTCRAHAVCRKEDFQASKALQKACGSTNHQSSLPQIFASQKG